MHMHELLQINKNKIEIGWESREDKHFLWIVDRMP